MNKQLLIITSMTATCYKHLHWIAAHHINKRNILIVASRAFWAAANLANHNARIICLGTKRANTHFDYDFRTRLNSGAEMFHATQGVVEHCTTTYPDWIHQRCHHYKRYQKSR